MSANFTTSVLKDKVKNATGIEVPKEIVEELGNGKKPAVKVTVNGYTYRTTIGIMEGLFMLPLSSENREKAGVKAGDEVEVLIELDLEPRVVVVPEDLELELSKINASEAFNKLSASVRKEYVRQVESAKSQETRERRIMGIVEKLMTK